MVGASTERARIGGAPVHTVLLTAMVLGIPASALSLAWWCRDAVRWVRTRRARSQSAPAESAGPVRTGAPPSPSSMRRGGGR